MNSERVLCVDDDQQVRSLIQRVVLEAGYECHGVGSVNDARELLAQEEFSVVLCDIGLPGSSGLELLDELGRTRPDIATVMVTGHDHVGIVDAALKREEIPLEGRIAAVADVFDALSSDRPYRPRLTLNEARTWILEGSGKAFDPKVVDAFVRSLQSVAA